MARGSAAADEWEQRLGRAVRELRRRSDLTQEILADRANVSLSALKNLESAKGSNTTTLLKVLRALDATDWIDELVPPPVFSPLDLLRQREGRR